MPSPISPRPPKSSPGLFWDGAVRSRLSQYANYNGTAHQIYQRFLLEERAMEHALATFRSHRNVYAPAARLPSKILALIFEYCAEGEGEEVSGALGWITVTHVCGRWRQVALEHPRLWRCVRFALGGRWAQAMLDRADGTPVFVDCFPVEEGPRRCTAARDLALINDHLYHTKSLEGMPWDNLRTLAPFFTSLTKPAPLLETLELTQDSVEPNAPGLSRGFLGGSAPNLRRISFENIRMPWTSPLLKNLVAFDWTIEWPEDADLVTLDEVLDVLQGMSQLERLTLSGCLPFCEAPALRPRRIVLPNLTYLYLNGSLADSTGLAQSLITPANKTAIIEMECAAADGFEKYSPALMAFVQTVQSSACPIVCASISASAPHDIWIEAGRAAPAPPRWQDMVLRFQHLSPTQHEVLEELCYAALLSPHLVSFRVGDPHCGVRFWDVVACRAPELQTVTACGPSAGYLLGLAFQRDTAEDSPDVSFPMLSSLRLDDVVYEGDVRGYEMSEGAQGVTLYRDLPFWLEAREARGHPLKTLAIGSQCLPPCGVPMWVRALKLKLPELAVTWL